MKDKCYNQHSHAEENPKCVFSALTWALRFITERTGAEGEGSGVAHSVLWLVTAQLWKCPTPVVK